MTINERFTNFRQAQTAGTTGICPRCGRMNMREPITRNALSRHENLFICSMCGTDEAIRDFTGDVLPRSDWFISGRGEVQA